MLPIPCSWFLAPCPPCTSLLQSAGFAVCFFFPSYRLAFSHCTAISHTPPFPACRRKIDGWHFLRPHRGGHGATCNPRRTKHLLVSSLWFRSNKKPQPVIQSAVTHPRFFLLPVLVSHPSPLPEQSVPDLPGAVNFQASGNGLRFPTQTTGSRPQSLVLAYPSRWDASERPNFL
ncbi:hypothetical protein EDB80DRAFT_712507 [Ilyonectria destructans]|nr:hypothetical protein EDB80DRAFT_712507 [Ilyonectria destructans]